MGARHVMPEDDQLEGLLPVHFVSQTDTEEESRGDLDGVHTFLFFPALTTVTSGHVAAGCPCLCCGLAVEKSEPDEVENEKKSDYLAATDVLIYSVIKAPDWMSAGSGPLRATGRGDKVGSSGGKNDLNNRCFFLPSENCF